MFHHCEYRFVQISNARVMAQSQKNANGLFLCLLFVFTGAGEVVSLPGSCEPRFGHPYVALITLMSLHNRVRKALTGN